MKFRQVIEYNQTKKILQKSYRKLGMETSSGTFIALYEVEASGLQLSFNLFR